MKINNFYQDRTVLENKNYHRLFNGEDLKIFLKMSTMFSKEKFNL